MDNKGFEVEEAGNTTEDEIQPSIMPAPADDACVSTDANCPCVESQSQCSCSGSKQETSRVELQTWVRPKGLLLIGVSVALVAWCTIYFTLSALQML